MFYMSRKFTRLAAFMLAASIATWPAFAEAGSPSLHDGVVVSPAHGVVYVMAPGGGIDGVDLETGSLVWHTSEAARPLALAGDRLIAQAEPDMKGWLPVVTFDTRKAGTVASRARIALPKDVRALIDDGLGKAFRVWADVAGTSEVLLSWSSTRDRLTGISPNVVDPTLPPLVDVTAAVVPAKSRVTSVRHSGAALLSLASGRVEETLANKARLAPRLALRELATSEGPADVSGRRFTSIDAQHVLISARQAGGSLEGATCGRSSIARAASG